MWPFGKQPKSDPSLLTFLEVDDNLETNVDGLYLCGDVTGYPLMKMSINQAYDLVERIADEFPPQNDENVFDLIIVGAGAAGLSAALTAKRRGLRYVVLEGDRTANTIENFHIGKTLFAEPDSIDVRGELWFEECTREELLKRWGDDPGVRNLNIRTGLKVVDVQKTSGGVFEVSAATGEKLRGARVILAVGKQGDPRKLGAPGEGLDKVTYKLFDPGKYKDYDVLVVGAGDQAAESVLALCDKNKVTMAVRGPELVRPKARNVAALKKKAAAGNVELLFNTTVKEIKDASVTLDADAGEREIPNDRIIINAGSLPPYPFLEKVGVKTADQWTPRRVVLFALFFSAITALYLFKSFWQKSLLASRGLKSAAEIANPVLSFLAVNWYGILYVTLVLGFGAWILSGRRGRHFRLHGYVKWRTISCMFFQTVFLFLLPLVPAGYLGAKAMLLTTVWPLTLTPARIANKVFMHGGANPELVFYAAFTIFLAFVAMPVFVYFHGKRYCSWICGCGALAETLGEPFRHLSPKGYLNRKRERIIYVVFSASIFASAALVLRNAGVEARAVADIQFWYNLIVYTIFSGIIGVGFYPFFGPRVWCRYLCPLAAYMNLLGAACSRYEISSNDRCIDCGQCNRFCEMGIDVKGFALKQNSFNLRNTPCIGCGECIAVCPMDVLKFGARK